MEDISALFEKHTVKEIQEIEKKTRLLIEKRKEDLRQMVGERYRDLLDAADAIAEMKNTVENVTKHIKSIEDISGNLHKNRIASNHHGHNTGRDFVKLNNCYEISAQAKLLMDIPEMVWQCVERADLLSASRLVSLAHHVYTQLESQVSCVYPVGHLVVKLLPLLHHQWAIMKHFQSVILQEADRVIRFPIPTSDRIVAEALCAILLLRDTTPRQVFADFLLARMSAIQDYLHPSRHGSTLKDQMCSVVRLLQDTLYFVDIFFYPSNSSDSSDNCGGVLKIVKQVLQESPHKALLSGLDSPLYRHLPQSINEFRPTLKSEATFVAADYLQENCHHWLETVASNLTAGVNHLLTYVNSVKNLVTLREAVETTLTVENYGRQWSEVCSRLLNRDLTVWETLFSPIFVKRVQCLVKSGMDKMLQSMKQPLQQSINDKTSMFQCESASFLWSESAGDVPINLNWNSSKPRERGNLSMKVKGFTLTIQSLCASVDGKLKYILEDVGLYLRYDAESDKLSSESSEIQLFIQSSFVEAIKMLLEYEEQQLVPLNKDDNSYISNVLMIAKLSLALGELCPYLESGVEGNLSRVENTNVLAYGIVLGTKPSRKAQENSSWSKLKEYLLDHSLRMFRIWKDTICKDFGEQCRNLLSTCLAKMIRSMPQWDVVSINEESEEGTTVKSTISVPMQPSCTMMTTLYNVCQAINKVGGHTVPRPILNEIHSEFLNEIVKAYETFIDDVEPKNKQISQSYSLQILFDIRFVASLTDSRCFTERIQSICEKLESFVDPFDLDVFSPYLQNHLRRCVKRCAVVLGLLVNPDRVLSFTASSTFGGSRAAHVGGSQQEPHNVLPLSIGGHSRFSLLPIASTTSVKSLSSGKDDGSPSTRVMSDKGGRSNTEIRQRSLSPGPMGSTKSVSSSFFGAMSSSWFGS